MAIVMRLKAVGATVEQYEQAMAIMGISGDDTAPDGLIQHIATTPGDGILAIDVWESEEKLNRFFEERAGAALAQAGLETSPPEIMKVHASIPKGKGTQPNVVMEIRIDRGADVYDEMVSEMPTHVGDGSGHPVFSHYAAVTDSGMYVVDLWESPEAFGKFAEQEIAPAAEGRLDEIHPTLIPVINVIRGKAAVPA